jgi:hypothetical protein
MQATKLQAGMRLGLLQLWSCPADAGHPVRRSFYAPFGRFGILDRPVEPGDDTALAATALRH